MKTKELVENRINEIWNEYSNFPFCQISPLCVSEISETGIIFIGLNPSLDEKNRIELEKSSDISLKYYDLDGKHKYFKKFPEMLSTIVLLSDAYNAPHDVLGDLYMSMEFGSKHNGQFFTPKNRAYKRLCNPCKSI